MDDDTARALFRVYEKMDTTTAAWKVPDAVLRSLEWVATEKVHGANLAIVVTDTGARCARRRGVLAEDEGFFGIETLLRGGLLDRARALWELAARWVAEHPEWAAVSATRATDDGAESADIAESLKQLSIASSSDRGAAGARPLAATLYGELYGGAYPHPEVPPAPDVPRPVQRGVYYCPHLEYMVFDIAVTFHDGSRAFLDFDLLVELCRTAGLPSVPVLRRGPLHECVDLELGFTTVLPSQFHHLPPLPCPNVSEGIVVRPARLASLGEAARAAVGANRLIVKFKDPGFAERVTADEQAAKQRRGGAGGASPSDIGGRDLLTLLVEHCRDLLVPARLDSAVSKVGLPSGRKAAAAPPARSRGGAPGAGAWARAAREVAHELAFDVLDDLDTAAIARCVGAASPAGSGAGPGRRRRRGGKGRAAGEEAGARLAPLGPSDLPHPVRRALDHHKWAGVPAATRAALGRAVLAESQRLAAGLESDWR